MGFVESLELLISAENKEYIINRIREELERQDKDLEDVYKEWCDSILYTEYAASELVSQKNIGIAEVLLHIFACLNNLEMVKYLVDKGADVNAVSYSECTALHFAAENNHLEVVKYLVGKGADVNAQDKLGFTPLLIAVRNGCCDTIEYFISHTKVNIDIKSYCSCTILHLAAESGNLDMVEYLVGKGANVNAQNDEGLTPSGIANKDGHLDIVKYFSEKRGASDAKNNSDSYIAAKRIKLDEVQSNKADIVLSVFDITSILGLNQISLNEKA